MQRTMTKIAKFRSSVKRKICTCHITAGSEVAIIYLSLGMKVNISYIFIT